MIQVVLWYIVRDSRQDIIEAVETKGGDKGVIKKLGIIDTRFYSLILARILHIISTHALSLSLQLLLSMATYSESLKRVYSSSPTLTALPPNY